MIALPNTKPVIDDSALVESIARRARETSKVKIYTYAAVTRGLGGREITEMGLLAESGAVGFTDGVQAVTDSQVLRRALSYANMVGKPIIQHPEDPMLARNGAMNEGEIATRLGIPRHSVRRRGDHGRARSASGRTHRRPPAHRACFDG